MQVIDGFVHLATVSLITPIEDFNGFIQLVTISITHSILGFLIQNIRIL
jgi:hypothetical protein